MWIDHTQNTNAEMMILNKRVWQPTSLSQSLWFVSASQLFNKQFLNIMKMSLTIYSVDFNAIRSTPIDNISLLYNLSVRYDRMQ